MPAQKTDAENLSLFLFLTGQSYIESACVLMGLLANSLKENTFLLVGQYYFLPSQYLMSQGIETYLKSFLAYKGFDAVALKKVGHSLEKLLQKAEEKGLFSKEAISNAFDKKTLTDAKEQYQASVEAGLEGEFLQDWKNAADQLKTDLKEWIHWLAKDHSPKTEYANRYLRSTGTGYPQFKIEALETGCCQFRSDLDRYFRHILGFGFIRPNHKIVWDQKALQQ